MGTFLSVFLGIIAANVVMIGAMFALYGSKKVRKWMYKKSIELGEEYVELLESDIEEL